MKSSKGVVRFADELEAAKTVVERQTDLEEQKNVMGAESASRALNVFVTDYEGHLFGLSVVPPNPDRSAAFEEEEVEDQDAEELAALQKSNPLRALLSRQLGSSVETKIASVMKLTPIAAGEIHAGCVRTVAVSGPFVVTGGQDESVRICKRDRMNPRKFTEFGALHRHDSSLTASVFSSDGNLLLTGDEDGLIYLWCTRRWECIGVLQGHRGAILALAMHPASPVALSVGRDNVLRLWDLRPNQFKQVVYVTLPSVMPVWGTVPQTALSIKFSPDGSTYALAYSRHVTIYLTSGTAVAHIEDSNLKVTSFSYLSQHIIAVGAEDGNVYVYDVEDAVDKAQAAIANGEGGAENDEGDEQKQDGSSQLRSGKLLGVLSGKHKNRVRFVASVDSETSAMLAESYPALSESSKFTSSTIHLDTFVITACSDGLIVAWRVVLSAAKSVEHQTKSKQRNNQEEPTIILSFKAVSHVNTKARITGLALNVASSDETKAPSAYSRCDPLSELRVTKRSRMFEQEDLAKAASKHSKRLQREARYGSKRKSGDDDDDVETWANASRGSEQYYDDEDVKKHKGSKSKADRRAFYTGGAGGHKNAGSRGGQDRSGKPFGKPPGKGGKSGFSMGKREKFGSRGGSGRK